MTTRNHPNDPRSPRPSGHAAHPARLPGLFAGVLVALALVVSGCGVSGSDDADATLAADAVASTDAESSLTDASVSEEVVTETAEESDDDGDDAMVDDAMPGDADAMTDAEDAMADTADSDDAMDATDEAATAAGASERSSASEGFFGTEDEEDVDETEDNRFEDYGIRRFVETSRDPLSTFALDVDTGSFSLARQWLANGQMPPPESVRVEEYVNSFDYDYPQPRDGLTVVADGGPSPFDPDNVLLRLGVQAETVANDDRPAAALTFIVDTSGSMDRHDRLGLVKDSLTTLVRELDGDDSVAIVTYGSDADVILEPTSASRSDVILDAIDRLRPDGSTNLEAGLYRGYDLAAEAFVDGGINRVILASDGVANVGLTDPDQLARTIRSDADRGIHLVTVGVGMGNFDDVVMEQLADQGDGFYAYVNDRAEADRLFGDELVSTLLTVAIDAKIQVEFDDRAVEAYRLIGFENRAVLDSDFRNDDVDAGELGAGHQVTALYELTLTKDGEAADRLGTAQLRWEDPETREVIETRLELTGSALEQRWADTSEDFRLAATVGAFAEVTRNSPYADGIALDQILAEAEALSASGQAGELVELLDQARRLR